MSLAGLAFGNKIDAPVYISQESGVVGLNFHQSKEVLISDSVNGSVYGVSSVFVFILFFFFCFSKSIDVRLIALSFVGKYRLFLMQFLVDLIFNF